MFSFGKKKQDSFEKYQITLQKAKKASREVDTMTEKLIAFNQQNIAQYERVQRV